MRKLAALAILAAFSPCAFGADGFAFTYRGCLKGASIPDRVEVQFALYERATGGAALWTGTNTVMPTADGVFQCELAGEGLAAAFTNANARFLGVSIGGEAEHYPRQEVFAAPVADLAESATRLAPGGSVGKVEAGKLSAQTMSIASLSLGGDLTFTKPGTTFTLSSARLVSGGTLTLKKGGEVSLLKQSAPQSYLFSSIYVNKPMFYTSSGGLVTVMSESRDDWDKSDGVPCVTWAVSPGNICPPFSVTHPVKVYFYPFGAAN